MFRTTLPLLTAVLFSAACVGPAPVPCVQCDGVCVDTQNDRRHCGACGTACAAGSVCTEGACVASCATGQTACSGQCVDTKTSPTNCGACGRGCATGEACVQGACTAVGGPTDAGTQCQAPLNACSGVCFDLRNDPGHCGTCTRACANTEYCTAGVCTALVVDAGPPPCPTGTSSCTGLCVDQQNDPRNCGMCGRACSASQYCSSGSCVQFPAMGLDAGTCIASSNPCEVVTASDGGCVVSLRTCPAPGACQTGGTCDPTSGACVYQNRTGSCDDSNACTTADVCVNGVCAGTTPRLCATPSACFETSVCIPEDGGCTAQPKAEGAACDDGDPCSGADTCVAGRCVGSIKPPTLDEFSQGSLPSGARWATLSADGGAHVGVANGQLTLDRAGRLVTAERYPVTAAAVRVTGEFTLGAANDWLHVWTRSTATPGAGFQLDAGLEFIVKPAALEVRSNGLSLATAAFDGGLVAGQPLVFEVFDDGASAQFVVHNKGGANETTLRVAASGAAPGNKVVFGTGNDTIETAGTSRFDLLRVEHGLRTRPTREWTFEEVTATGVLGGSGLLPDGGSAGARNARFVSAAPGLQSTAGSLVNSGVAAGPFGAAASFSSVDGGRFVEFPSDIVGSTAGDVTVSFWVLGNSPSGIIELFGNRFEGSGGTFLSVRSSQALGITAEFDRNASPYVPLGVAPTGGALVRVTDDQWHHVAVTRDARLHSLYVDGQLREAVDAGGVGDFGKATPWWAGRGYSSTGNGAFDELRVYDSVALNTCEVARLASQRSSEQASCTGGRVFCVASSTAPGVCIDAQSDVNNCGACGRVCATPQNATASCAGGACGSICTPGFLDCNGLASDGCETRGVSCRAAAVLVSVALDGGAGSGQSTDPTVDDSGNLVVFTSTAADLVPNDTNNQADVFLRNLAAGTTTRLSVDLGGNELATGGSGGSISADGRFAAFITSSPAVVPDTNGSGLDVIIVNLTTNARTFGMLSGTGGQPGGNTEPFSGAVLSRDGRYVLWSTRATSLYPGDTVQNESDIYVYDRQTNTMRMASLNSSGGIVTTGGLGFNTGSGFFTGQGRWVGYSTFAAILGAGTVTPNCGHGFFVDMNPAIPVPTRVERDNAGGVLTCPAINTHSTQNLLANFDGTAFFFSSRMDMASGATRANYDIYRRPTITGASTLITAPPGGGAANGDSFAAFLSDDGQTLGFSSTATNLAPDNNGAARDCFVWRAPSTLLNVSQPVSRALGGAGCNGMRLSRAGQYAVLEMADALSPADQNATADIYLRWLPDAR